jgi:hypothetical protein
METPRMVKTITGALLGNKAHLATPLMAVTAKAVLGTKPNKATILTALTQKAVAISAPKLATKLSAIEINHEKTVSYSCFFLCFSFFSNEN